ncbi:hypothetical protein FACS1894182_10430 [Bacteroidia bacterium]|nr:hypothetical protein FACS1894182_10430 [Bacteroidia bacterium]
MAHIQETLVKNIEDNFLVDDVEFILLDYNSTDGLEEWVKTLSKYIDMGILTYYRTTIPENYHRSHSRNMAFRLSNAEIVCNLDADNFLGQGFADYVFNEFDKHGTRKIFLTSNFSLRDTLGKFCASQNDFMQIKGYNESLSGYGVEDIDLYARFVKMGLKQIIFYEKKFYSVIYHSHQDRISQEERYKSSESLYLSHQTPFLTKFLLLHKNLTCEMGALINNELCNYNIVRNYSNAIDAKLDYRNRITLDGAIVKGSWMLLDDNISLNVENTACVFYSGDLMMKYKKVSFYKVTDNKLFDTFLMRISAAINYEIRNNQSIINPDGFGKGVVYKNFDYKHPIILD